MDPRFFGSGTWIFLFVTIFSCLSVENVKKNLFQCMRNLPCYQCSMHSQKFLREKKFFNMTHRYEILITLIELRNRFYDKIDTSKIKSDEDVFIYEDEILKAVILKQGLTL